MEAQSAIRPGSNGHGRTGSIRYDTVGLDVEPEPADWRSLLDIVRLMVFAVLLRLAEMVAIEGDTPGWWRDRE